MNIAEILKDCPIGTKLWSPLCGDCNLYTVACDGTYPIVVNTETGQVRTFTSEGKYLRYEGGECLLFPSKENRDWTLFRPQQEPRFKPYDRVLVRDIDTEEWRCAIFSHVTFSEKYSGKYVTENSCWKQCIPYEGNEHLLGTTDNPDYSL